MPASLSVGDLIDEYRAPPATYDEMASAEGLIRPHYQEVANALGQFGTDDFVERAERLGSAFRDQGVTFDLDGEERPFPLDVVPRLFESAEWSEVDAGLVQRVRALEAFLADVYTEGRILAEGVVPRRVVVSSPGFVRVASGVEPANGVRVHVAGIDLIRDEDGRLRVLEDNLRCPSGVSYVLANRRAMARILPELFTGQAIGTVSDYPARLAGALRSAAPPGVADPRVVVLTPGVFNSAFYEHALLARLMGADLAEGRDLVCRGTDVFLRTIEGEVPVHVVYRRIDDEYLDPLQFRPDSLLGCPGIVNAARAGRVTVANGVGNGIADDKLIYTYVPDMIRFYLGEDPILRNVETYRLIDDDQRTEAFARMGELVWKKVDGSGGKGLVMGPEAPAEELRKLRAEVESRPRAWIAQPVVRFSTAPTWTGQAIEPRHVDLRPFVVNDGKQIWTMPGGLTRVALSAGGLVVNSSQGGGSKDTWVMGGTAVGLSRQPVAITAARAPGPPLQLGPHDGGSQQ